MHSPKNPFFYLLIFYISLSFSLCLLHLKDDVLVAEISWPNFYLLWHKLLSDTDCGCVVFLRLSMFLVLWVMIVENQVFKFLHSVSFRDIFSSFHDIEAT